MDDLLKSENIHIEQKERIRKSMYQTLYLLSSKITDDTLELHISGSTLNVYEIKIIESSAKCNCPDYYRTNSKGLFCKHVCFVICIIGRIFDENIFINRALSLEDKFKIMFRVSNNCGGDPNIINSTFTDRFNKAVGKETTPGPGPGEGELIRNIEEDCPVCYISLKEPKDVKLYTCIKCSNAVHKECFDMWMKYNKSCVFCRTDIVLNIGKSKGGKYINIA